MIVDKPKQNGIVIDLTGPQGNAYFLMGMVKKLSNQLDLNGNKILKDMMSGDYENLIQVFDKNFGSVVTLYR
jgi:hypothetical protein